MDKIEVIKIALFMILKTLRNLIKVFFFKAILQYPVPRYLTDNFPVFSNIMCIYVEALKRGEEGGIKRKKKKPLPLSLILRRMK